MTVFDDNFTFNYIRNDTYAKIHIEPDDELNFLYDYNEVQELYGNGMENDVYIAGATNLHKTDMLRLIVKNLLSGGIDDRNVVFIDFVIPFVRSMRIQKIISYFAKTMKTDEPLYVIINEVALYEDWAESIKTIKVQYPFTRFLCSSSISPAIHEYFYDHPDNKSKIIVLSAKNESNIKYKQDHFGVFNDFKYNIKQGICEIKGLTKQGKQKSRHIVPDIIEGYPVKIISSGAFHHRTELTEIILPDSIEFIGDYAFTYCKNLSDIHLPEKLVYIGDCAFLGATGLKAINGGANIAHIGNSAFYATTWLTENKSDFVVIGKTLYKYNGKMDKIEIPRGIDTIGFYAFANTAIKTIDLSSIKKIHEGAFFNCYNLLTIDRYNIDYVGAFQFYKCIKLKNFSFIFANAGKFAFKDCVSLETVKLSEAEISDGVFENCNKLNEIDNEKLFSVGVSAFFNVPVGSLDLTFTESIGKFAFYNANLHIISLNVVKDIGDYAFADNKLLKEVSINNLANIGHSIFLNCSELKTATLGGRYILNAYFGEASPIEKLHVIGNCTDNFCRGSKQLQEVDIEGDSIGNWAFYACSSLKSVKLTAKTLGVWCFAYCDRIKEITLPNDIKFIAMNAFRYCRNLAKIIIPTNKPLHFGVNAFYSTSENKRFYVSDRNMYINVPIWKEYINEIEEI